MYDWVIKLAQDNGSQDGKWSNVFVRGPKPNKSIVKEKEIKQRKDSIDDTLPQERCFPRLDSLCYTHQVIKIDGEGFFEKNEHPLLGLSSRTDKILTYATAITLDAAFLGALAYYTRLIAQIYQQNPFLG